MFYVECNGKKLISQDWQRMVFDGRKTVFAFHVLFEMSNGVMCSMLDVLFDALFDVLFYRHRDDQRVFAVLFGTQLVVPVDVFREHVLCDVVFALACFIRVLFYTLVHVY